MLVIVLAMRFAWRSRRRCPYRNPLCRPSKPCLLCYRDLYKTIVAEREPSENSSIGAREFCRLLLNEAFFTRSRFDPGR